MSEDELRKAISTRVDGVLFAATDLIRMMDRPGMNIDHLRASNAAGIFRDEIRKWGVYLFEAIAAAPSDALASEEKRLLQYLFREIDLKENKGIR